MTTEEHIAALRAALEAGPTAGSWYADSAISGDGFVVMSEAAGIRVAHCHDTGHLPFTLNAAYIAAAHPAAIRSVLDALEAAQVDAERYRFIRDADRSDCITPELALYAMESLDEYVDAAMEDEMRNAAITNTGA